VELHNDPNWLRAGHWISNSPEADLAIVGVGASKSAITPNKSSLTPDAIREALLRFSTYEISTGIDLAEKIKAVDLGNLSEPDDQLKSSSELEKISNKYLILLGGDNSITFTGVKALAEKVGFENIGLITLDAHHDLRDGISNGSPIRQLIEAGLPGNQIVQIGISDFANSKFYAERARSAGIKVIARQNISDINLEEIALDALAFLDKVNYIYLDIDIDVCDRSVVPAAPAALPGGLSANQLLNLVYLLAKDQKVNNFDITEIDSSIDSPDKRTTRLAALCILKIAAAKAL
jgi:formiminoglutamase